MTDALTLETIPGRFSIHRFAPDHELDGSLYIQAFCWIARTDAELTVVCPDSVALDSPQCEPGWRCLRAGGPLDFSLTGILSGLSAVLAEADVSIFALSTFDTDYLMVPEADWECSVNALKKAGYRLPGLL